MTWIPVRPLSAAVAMGLIYCGVVAGAESADFADAAQPANVASDASKEPAKKEDDKAKSLPPAKRETEGFDILTGPTINTEGSSVLLDAKRTLRSAEIRLKLASTELGNLHEFDGALAALEHASRDLSKVMSPHSGKVVADVQDLNSEIRVLRSAASATFFGRFPLVRAYGLWPEIDEEFIVHSYSRPGEAHRRAVHGALTQIAKTLSNDPLHVLILVPGESVDERKTGLLAKLVDSQARDAFANVANVTLYLGALRAVVDPMPSWNAPDSAFDPICRQFLKRVDNDKEPYGVMLVMVREFIDDDHDGIWVQAQQRTYEAATLEKAEDSPEKLEADKVKVFQTLTHDRSRFGTGLLIAAIAAYLIALGVHRLLGVASHTVGGGWQRWIAIPTAGFAIGMGLTPFIMLAMKRWLPEAQADALSSLWWPAIAGALSLVLPAGVFRLGAGAIGRYLPGLSCHGRWGIAFVPVAIGASAAWMSPMCQAVGLHAIYIVVMLGLASSFIVYCFGRAVDVADEFPVALTPFTVGLSLMFGAAAFMGSPVLLGLVTILAIVTNSVQLFWRRPITIPASDADLLVAYEQSQTPRTLEQLQAALKAPQYHPPRALERFKSTIESADVSKALWIGLVGPVASGKTAAAWHLIDRIQTQHPETQVLAGQCSEDSQPFHPFREALAELGASAGIIASSSHVGEVNTIFERLADEFIPFWDFFSVDTDDADGKEASRPDLLEGVVNVLRKLTHKHPVVIFLDDVQWIDEGSAGLLKHLRDSFVSTGKFPLTIILAGRDETSLGALALESAVFTLPPPSVSEQVHFLQHSFGIEVSCAKHLVKALGVMSREAGSIFWLIRAVTELVHERALVPGSDGFKLGPSYLETRQLPVPQAMRAKLGASLRASGQYLPVLECAALLGEKFRVDDVAECLGMDRLLLLQILRHLEQELQLVRDVRTDQDSYAFSSEFMLEIVREELGVGGTRKSQMPSKIARELHARIATVLARRTPRTAHLAYELARHYHAAGTAYANECVDHCLAAAEIACRRRSYRSARGYLALAEECARIKHRSVEITDKRLWIDAEEAKNPPQRPSNGDVSGKSTVRNQNETEKSSAERRARETRVVT